MMSPFVSQLGLSVYLIGLNWLIVEATGTTKQLGIIQAVSGVAFIITDVFVGVLVDKYNPKVLILLTNLLSALDLTSLYNYIKCHIISSLSLFFVY